MVKMGNKDLKYYSITVWYMYSNQNTKQIKLSTSDIPGLPWDSANSPRSQFWENSFFTISKKFLFLLRFLWKLPFPQNFKCMQFEIYI